MWIFSINFWKSSALINLDTSFSICPEEINSNLSSDEIFCITSLNIKLSSNIKFLNPFFDKFKFLEIDDFSRSKSTISIFLPNLVKVFPNKSIKVLLPWFEIGLVISKVLWFESLN